MGKKLTRWQLGFVQGQVWAAADVIRAHGEDTIAGDLIACVSVDDLRFCAETDLEVLRGANLIPLDIRGVD